VLYLLDEPSIGLHPRDNDRLIAALQPVADCTPAEMIERVKMAVAAFAGSVTSADDFTLVITRKTAIA